MYQVTAVGENGVASEKKRNIRESFEQRMKNQRTACEGRRRARGWRAEGSWRAARLKAKEGGDDQLIGGVASESGYPASGATSTGAMLNE